MRGDDEESERWVETMRRVRDERRGEEEEVKNGYERTTNDERR